jgi:hypothetical protein
MTTQHITVNWDINEAIGDEDISQFAWSEEMQKAIDQEIVDDIIMQELISEGWHCPECKYSKYNADISAWVHLNARGKYGNFNGKWLFENAADATMFTLKWAR